jgi:hypothetical protein
MPSPPPPPLSSLAPSKKRPRQLAARRNAKVGEDRQKVWWSPDDDDDDYSNVDDYTEEDLNSWIEDYMSWARRERGPPLACTSPQETQAQPTPEGQGDLTLVAVVEGWVVETVMPIRTAKLV